MKKIINKILLFFVPILIIIVALISKYGYEDFFDLFIINDLQTQYRTLFEWFRNVLQGKENLLYSFYKGLGGNMISTFAYYLSSPINLILFFFKNTSINTIIGIIILIKIGISSITFNYFLNYKFKNTNSILSFIYSIIYALSGYVICYNSNLMWLDIYYMLPIVIVGVDKILNNEKPYLYIFSLFLCFIMNFYITYSLCLFIIIYFLYNILLIENINKKVFFNYSKKFLIYSFISIFLSGILLVPTILDMINNMFRYKPQFTSIVNDLINIKMILSRLFIGSMNLSIRYCGSEASIYISLFSLISFIMYFFNKKISKKERKVSLIVILFFVASICFNFLNFIWHGFSFPNGYNYRFSYLLIFFALYISYKNILLFNYKFDKKHLLIIIPLLTIICLFIKDFSYIDICNIVITIVFLSIYYLIFIFYKKINKIFIFVIVILELFINTRLSFIVDRSGYNNDPNTVDVGYVIKINLYDYEKNYKKHLLENKFNRNEEENIFSLNENFQFSYPSVSTFLTTNNKRLYNFMYNVGTTVTYSTIVKTSNNGKFIDSFLGIKYLYLFSYNKIKDYNKIDEFDLKLSNNISYNKFIIYENTDALNLGFIINENESIDYNNNPYEYQNDLFKYSTGLDLNIFEKVDYTLSRENDRYKLKFKNENHEYYGYISFGIPINYENFGAYSIGEKNLYTDLTSFSQGSIKFDETDDDYYDLYYLPSESHVDDYYEPYIYYFNYENYNKGIEILKQNQLELTLLEKNKLNGSIDSKSDGILMITIPYEKGWNIYIDGKKTDYFEVYDSFIGIDITKGEHNIEMKFIPPGIKAGTIVSLIGLCGVIIIYIYDKKEGNKNEK